MSVSRIPIGSSGRASAKAPWRPPDRLLPPPAPSCPSGRPLAPKASPGTPRAPACPPTVAPKRHCTHLPVLQTPAKKPSAVGDPTSPTRQMPDHCPQIKALPEAPKSRLPRRQSSHPAGRLTTASGFGSRPAPAHLGKRKEPTESQPRDRGSVPLATSSPVPSHTPCHIGQQLQQKAQQLQKWTPKISRCSVTFPEDVEIPMDLEEQGDTPMDLEEQGDTPMDFQEQGDTPMDFQEEGAAPLV